jgi:branched-chain amino acid transport system ATP-binding protein
MSESAGTVTRAEPLMRAEGLTRRFGGVLAIDDVSITMWPSEVLGLVGPNGAGKTTFVNLITSHDRPNEGHVFWEGHDTTRMAKEKVANVGVARTYQHLRLLEGSSVLENVLIGYHRRIDLHVWQIVSGRRRSEAEAKAAALESLRRVGIEPLEGRLVNSLSYGTRRKVEIARALVSRPTALVLDEPTAGMTASEAADIAATVRSLRDEGMGVLLIEHNVGLVTSLCDRIAVLEWGALIAEGTPAEVWDNPQVRSAYLGVT